MASDSSDEAPFRVTRRLRLLLITIVVLVVAWAVGGQILWFWLNTIEFGELFILPIYFELIGGVVLATLALVRIDLKNRRSLVWWALRLILRVFREHGVLEYVPPEYFDFKSFRLPLGKFVTWQATKVLLGMLLFANVLFGLAVFSMSRGWDPALGSLTTLLGLPFTRPPFDMNYALERVVPMLPSLTLLITPIFGALGTRLLLLVIATQLVRVFAPSFVSTAQEPLNVRAAIVEGLAALVFLWVALTLFFPSYINYNTPVIIGGVIAAGVTLAVFAFLDGYRRRGLSLLVRRPIYLRVGAVIIIALLVGSITAVFNSTADARKVEWLGPYTVQEIAVNRHVAELDGVREVPYDFAITVIPPARIDAYAEAEKELLSKIRLWDWDAGFAKLKPEIGLIPYLDFEDSDILRFNNTLYWSASMKPVMPPTVRPEDRWFAEHLFYTNVPIGFLILDGNQGEIKNTTQFFQQRRIYYGEGGLFGETWAAYPMSDDRPSEVGEHFYGGSGGITLPPPISWLFEFNFFLGFRDQPVHVLRYRDVFDRMRILFPYFQYFLERDWVDMLPVTDGADTYWLMPLIVSLDTDNVPWSGRTPFRRLVGYALIDIYDGKIQLLITGDDFFSDLFKRAYRDYVTTEIPDWLKNQLRYPTELFDWRISVYNFYHVTDAATFIVAKEFFEVPRGLESYYIIAKPPGFDAPEYLGLISLELRGAGGRNLAGYMVVRNDYPYLGDMIFYQVPLGSVTKLLGPTAVLEALEKNPEFATLKTLLRNPRIGDIILYRVGEHDVYFIPVYTAGAGGVVTEMGVVAAVGATFTGKYYVGLGTAGTADSAFKVFLRQLAGVEAPPPPPLLGLEERRTRVVELFMERGIALIEPTALNPHVSFSEGSVKFVSEADWSGTQDLVLRFIRDWAGRADRVLGWQDKAALNLGVLINVNGIVELHFITIQLE